MLIQLSELFSPEGKEKTYTPDMDMTVYHGPDGNYELAAKEPVLLRIVNLGNRRFYLEGKTALALTIPCSRCLDPVQVEMGLDLVRTLDCNELKQEDAEIGEQPYLKGSLLDVDQLVCDEIILNLPMKVLCGESCKGICNRCGANLNHETCDCDNGPSDPRMAVIQDIFKKFKEV